MVNKVNIDKVIAAIQSEDNYFNMSWFSRINDPDWKKPISSNCGTASCICGWANLIKFTEDGGKDFSSVPYDDNKIARSWLGLDRSDEDYLLFWPDIGNIDYITGQQAIDDITRQQAIDTLERLKTIGKVEWIDIY